MFETEDHRLNVSLTLFRASIGWRFIQLDITLIISMLARRIRIDLNSARRSFSSQAPKVQNFINGKFEDSKATQWIDLYNPATQEVVCRVPQSTPEELKRAELGALEAFQSWKEVPVQQRQVI